MRSRGLVERFAAASSSDATVADGANADLHPQLHGKPRARDQPASSRGASKFYKSGKGKSVTGRTFTSKFRGVHQTFPTRRWEAQFRRNGKPTSLGCFDHEEEAARSYDRMMIWCHLHKELSCKLGITNYEMKEYEKDYDWLMRVTQEELIESLRSDGRRQAATRQLRMKQQGYGGLPATQFEERQDDLVCTGVSSERTISHSVQPCEASPTPAPLAVAAFASQSAGGAGGVDMTATSDGNAVSGLPPLQPAFAARLAEASQVIPAEAEQANTTAEPDAQQAGTAGVIVHASHAATGVAAAALTAEHLGGEPQSASEAGIGTAYAATQGEEGAMDIAPLVSVEDT